MVNLYLFPVKLFAQEKLLAHWRFEQIQLKGNTVPSVVGQPLNPNEVRPSDPQGFISDDTGNGNFLQVFGARQSSSVFSDNVPKALIDGTTNTRSLAIKRGEYVVNSNRPLPFYDMQRSWTIEASLMNNLLGTEQVFLCKEGEKGAIAGDVSVGFDNMHQKYFAEVMCADGIPRRVVAGDGVVAGKWYDIKVKANYNMAGGNTILTLSVKASDQTSGEKSDSIIFKGPALNRNVGLWVIGRGFPTGFPNNLAVLDGGIDEVRIYGESLPRKNGQNPIFTDALTADPAALVVGNTVYVYVGQDVAPVGGWFNMPNWRCYSTTDMKNWTSHGPVLSAKDFPGAYSGASWAAQVVAKNGKYYYYVTLDRKDGHYITVAVSDSPTGPFKPAHEDGSVLITDSMTLDSHRKNSDIDPTVFIDDDGTPWMAWGNGDCYIVKLKKNMVALDGPITKMPMRNYAEGPWIFKRGNLYYNIYAADAPGVQPEQICYATATKITGPWTYRGFITGPAKHGFTIHPAVIEFKKQWYFFYHDGSYMLNGVPGGDARRMVCVEYLYFNNDGTIKPIKLTTDGISIPSKKI